MGEKFSLNGGEKKFCISLARKSIAHFFEAGGQLEFDGKKLKEIPKKLLGKKACFVTLTKGGELKGCIGHLEATQQLYLDIIENAVNAAFGDPRFFPLTRSELPEIKIEVSILTDPVEMKFASPEDLLRKIVAGEDGLIIRKGFRGATFLPSVWEELPEKEEFLSHLCMKAGLSPYEWKLPGMKVSRYGAIKAGE